MKLWPLDVNHESDIMLLWKLLNERKPEQSISHKYMPTWDEHCAFVYSYPYSAWFIIEDTGFLVGACYVTKHDEIGIGILDEYQGKGYGKAAVKEIIRLRCGRLLANINPANTRSIRLFESLGFKQIQATYELGERE
jgi:RimJ/RimL family protein N-acetyltransferase